jgi:hypothetical protein
MHWLLSSLTMLVQQPHPMPYHEPGVWWTHWTWMLLWILITVVVILLVVRLLRPPRR